MPPKQQYYFLSNCVYSYINGHMVLSYSAAMGVKVWSQDEQHWQHLLNQKLPGGPGNLYFNKTFRWFWCIIKSASTYHSEACFLHLVHLGQLFMSLNKYVSDAFLTAPPELCHMYSYIPHFIRQVHIKCLFPNFFSIIIKVKIKFKKALGYIIVR